LSEGLERVVAATTEDQLAVQTGLSFAAGVEFDAAA
jgi:hypothetical protein